MSTFHQIFNSLKEILKIQYWIFQDVFYLFIDESAHDNLMRRIDRYPGDREKYEEAIKSFIDNNEDEVIIDLQMGELTIFKSPNTQSDGYRKSKIREDKINQILK